MARVNKDYPPVTPQTFKTALPANKPFYFVSAHTIFPYEYGSPTGGTFVNRFTQTVFENDVEIFNNVYKFSKNANNIFGYEGEDIGSTITLKNNAIYKVVYVFYVTNNGNEQLTNTATYIFSAIENKLPLKKQTVTDVINRLLDLAEPIRKGEKPRFRLNAEQAAKFDKIISPQFAFTKQTLRECLQEVGRFIHGEPRLKIKKDDAGYYYEVIYDMYSSQEGTNLQFIPYTSKGCEHIINNYTAWVDSNAQHLVNELDKYSGVIVEPTMVGGKTVRTENQYVRVTDENMLIATQFPIYTVEKLEYVYEDGLSSKSVDITQYVFESSEYSTRLSSYSEQYPYSKAYALYFTQGEKNIRGLNFKVPAAAFADFKKYAIVNILKQVAPDLELPDLESEYPLLAFRVTYTPIYDARVEQTKVNYLDFNRPAALIVNQQSNIIESRYYGENLKGVVARLGNIELSLTYITTWMYNVPRAGMRFGKDYYISAVAIELLPTYIRFTIGLSKDFNRISAYIGVPSEKRYYEVSQTQAVERSTLWREFIVVGKQETPDADALIGQQMVQYVANTFLGRYAATVSHVRAWGTTYNGAELPAVDLPVISSAFGNSMSFSWQYQNNYSAGAMVTKRENSVEGADNQTVTGYWQDDARYCDYYGRIYYYNFMLAGGGVYYSEAQGLSLPQSTVPNPGEDEKFVSTIGKTPYILRKDSRESLQINFQIDFVSNSDIIIGSALAAYCPAVRSGNNTDKPKLYVFPTDLNKFTDHVEAWEDVDLSTLPSAEISVDVQDGYFTVNAANFPASGKSWAIVTAQTAKSETVEDEQGGQTTQTTYYGGDLLIGQNIEITAGQAFTPIYFTKKRKIFDETVWKDRR